jgi:hypothetical protein
LFFPVVILGELRSAGLGLDRVCTAGADLPHRFLSRPMLDCKT